MCYIYFLLHIYLFFSDLTVQYTKPNCTTFHECTAISIFSHVHTLPMAQQWLSLVPVQFHLYIAGYNCFCRFYRNVYCQVLQILPQQKLGSLSSLDLIISWVINQFQSTISLKSQFQELTAQLCYIETHQYSLSAPTFSWLPCVLVIHEEQVSDFRLNIFGTTQT